ncbi:MAG: uroporphyrinogen-III synthase [Bacteroidetes bacterium]|nr:MAG: uroporphyrinogen-III synthase [Bacteroidota bacterium]
MKIKSVLVTQPKPESDKSPYSELSQKFNLKIDFVPFFHMEGIAAKEFRKERINLPDYTGIIITSRHCIDHYFRLCQEMRFEVPETMKYFCTSEAIAYYIQKYILYRKRKVFHGQHNIRDLAVILRKHKNEKFLLPHSNVHNKEIDGVLDGEKINYTKALFYRAVPSDLSHIKTLAHDMLVFFSPADVKSLTKNFPKFRQRETLIAAFGSTTAKAVQNAGFRLNIQAPTLEAPSMTKAIENHIRYGFKSNK